MPSNKITLQLTPREIEALYIIMDSFEESFTESPISQAYVQDLKAVKRIRDKLLKIDPKIPF